MANTQINVTSNGTTTLATAGKYCDRHIDVNVAVPASGITPTGSISITENGAYDVTRYASAEVEVTSVQPTQFTNLYDPANVTLDYYVPSSGDLTSLTSSTEVNVLKIPYHHVAGEPVQLRMRGLCNVRSRAYVAVSNDGVSRLYSVQWHQYSTITFDEYGDAVWEPNTTKGVVTNAWEYLYINFQYPFLNSGDSQLSGPIVTINEPIGNGGAT